MCFQSFSVVGVSDICIFSGVSLVALVTNVFFLFLSRFEVFKVFFYFLNVVTSMAEGYENGERRPMNPRGSEEDFTLPLYCYYYREWKVYG